MNKLTQRLIISIIIIFLTSGCASVGVGKPQSGEEPRTCNVRKKKMNESAIHIDRSAIGVKALVSCSWGIQI